MAETRMDARFLVLMYLKHTTLSLSFIRNIKKGTLLPLVAYLF